MSDDLELDQLKARRLAEMQKNITTQHTPQDAPKPEKPNPRQIVIKSLGYRGEEVLKNAESQFPNQVPLVIQKLAELISSGEINETLDGGKLLSVFRSIGLNIRMETTIHVEKDGKFVSLSDKLGSAKTADDV